MAQEQQEIAIMNVYPVSERRLAMWHFRSLVSMVCGSELRYFHALSALYSIWVRYTGLPQDDTSLCALYRVGLAREVLLQEFKLPQSIVIIQLSPHERPPQKRRELENRLKMVRDRGDSTSTRPKKVFVIRLPVRRLVRVWRLIEGWLGVDRDWYRS